MMVPAFVVVLSALVFGLGGVGTAADWPTYMHDNSRVGFTEDPLAAPLKQSWVFESPVEPQRAFSGPEKKMYEGKELRSRIRFDDVFHVAMAGGRVFFGSSVDGRVHCIDAATGNEVWSFFTDGPVRLAPTVADGRVFVGSDDGCAYCLDAGSGEVIWKLSAGPRDERLLARGRMTSRWPVRTSLMVDDETVYFGAGVFPAETVFLYAVEAATGRVIWKNDWISQRDAGRDDLSPQGYMLAKGDKLFVPSGRSMPAAINRKTGERIYKPKPSWRQDGGGQVGSSAAMLVDDQLYSVAEHHVLALNQEHGKTGFGWFLARRMTMAGDIAHMANGKQIIAVDHAKRAEATRERHPLDLQYAKTVQLVKRHRAPVAERRAKEAKAKLEAARAALAKVAAKSAPESPEHVAATKAVADAEAEHREQAAEFERRQADLDKLVAKRDGLKERIDELKQVAIKWRFESKHESALVLAGNALVAGGKGEVVVLDSDTGAKLWSAEVEGEARGLAVSDGRLVVSTTEGKVYCFAPQGGAAIVGGESEAGPFAVDGVSETYVAAANAILAESGVTTGFCLVVGAEEGSLAYELARQSELVVFGIEPDAEKVKAARRKLAGTGLYGTRITIDHVEPGAPVPYPNYFANLIVSETLLRTAKMPGNAIAVARHLKPIGGVICLGVPQANIEVPSNINDWIRGTGLVENEGAKQATRNGWSLLTRGTLPGADGWSHPYGNAGNTSSNKDERVKAGLGVLWYGDPGPEHMVNRHDGAMGPVSVNGRLFIQTDHSVMAYDAYNGQFLWEVENAGATRAGMKKAYEPGNMVATDEDLFMVVGAGCIQIDVASGDVRRRYAIPDAADGEGERQWTYISVKDGVLFGTSTDREKLTVLRKTKNPLETRATDKVFAYDTKSGGRLWTYQGKSISHVTIAVGSGRIFFVDATMSAEQREAFLKQDKSEFEKLTGKERERAEQRLKKQDLRLAVALDARTGKQAWAKPVDVTDCSEIGIGGGTLSMMVANEHLVLGGANANGHYWKQFLSGEFERRRVVVLSAATGEKVWAKDANYRHRPIVVGHEVIAEPWSYDLYTGEQKMRAHPLTGEETPWKFIRPGHHCGAISASPNMLFFRSYFTAYYDLEDDGGTQHFGGHRLGCWINSIPANGLVMVPEASAGCVCLFSIAATVVFEPRDEGENWGVFTAEGARTPVRHMALNLGAPGDRRDEGGKLWLGYPRPSSRDGLDLPVKLDEKFGEGGRFKWSNSQELVEDGTTGAVPPWVFASGGSGLTRCELLLRKQDQAPANYTVRLIFGSRSWKNVTGVKLQGQAVQPALDTKCLGGRMIEYRDVNVSGKLLIEVESSAAVLSGIEVLEKGAAEIRH